MRQRGSRSALALASSLCALSACVVTADESLWQRCPLGACADRAADRPADSRPFLEARADVVQHDRQRDRLPGDLGSKPDQLATYNRTWITATLSTTPGRTWGPKLAYDGDQGLVILYGGRQAGVPVAMSWSYDGKSWQPLCLTCPPGPRVGHGMVYDESRKVVLLFGGDGGSGPRNDLWELSGGTWKQVIPGGAPSPRSGVMMAYDRVRARTVVFGGQDAGGALLDEVYEYDGAAWKGPLAPAVRPPPRQTLGSAATYADSKALSAGMRDRVVIFAGSKTTSESGVLDDCWAWDGATWTPICTSCTGTPRSSAAVSYDPATGRGLAINGWSGVDEIEGTLEHLASGWQLTTNLPGKRDTSGVAFDVKRNRLVLFGGNGASCGGDCQETLEYASP